MDALFSVIIFVIGGGIGFMLTRKMLGTNYAPRAELSVATALKDDLQAQKTALEDALKTERENAQIAAQKIATLQTQKAAQEELITAHKTDLETMQEAFTQKFELLATRIFEEKTTTFKKDSQEGLSQLLTPFKERITAFEKRVEDSFGNHAKEQHSLKKEIERIVFANTEIVEQTRSLTEALKGDSKLQGNWGETVLEKILQASGLREGDDYTTQGTGYNLSADDGGKLRPDVIINLPDNKHIIVDSKVSLTHYERYFASTDEAERNTYLSQFLLSVKKHINELSAKSYETTAKLESPDFVLMFIPIEGAYALALQADPNLQNIAWDKRIVLVCPATLFATLRTVASVWRIEQQNRNTLEIARQGGNLYNEVVLLAESMEKLGKKISDTKDAYDDTFSRLKSKRGNLLKRTEDLKKLGVSAKKQIPTHLLEIEQDDINTDDEAA